MTNDLNTEEEIDEMEGESDEELALADDILDEIEEPEDDLLEGFGLVEETGDEDDEDDGEEDSEDGDELDEDAEDVAFDSFDDIDEM